jgi:hypothetical protein
MEDKSFFGQDYEQLREGSGEYNVREAFILITENKECLILRTLYKDILVGEVREYNHANNLQYSLDRAYAVVKEELTEHVKAKVHNLQYIQTISDADGSHIIHLYCGTIIGGKPNNPVDGQPYYIPYPLNYSHRVEDKLSVHAIQWLKSSLDKINTQEVKEVGTEGTEPEVLKYIEVPDDTPATGRRPIKIDKAMRRQIQNVREVAEKHKRTLDFPFFNSDAHLIAIFDAYAEKDDETLAEFITTYRDTKLMIEARVAKMRAEGPDVPYSGPQLD